MTATEIQRRAALIASAWVPTTFGQSICEDLIVQLVGDALQEGRQPDDVAQLHDHLQAMRAVLSRVNYRAPVLTENSEPFAIGTCKVLVEMSLKVLAPELELLETVE